MTKAPDGYDIEAVRAEWIGRSTERVRGRYPVEYDPIRRHCHMVEDANDLYLDPEAGAASRFGGVIAPPVMLAYFASNGAWPRIDEAPVLALQVPTRGDKAIVLNQEMFFYEPVRVGDHLSCRTVIVDVYEKAIRLDPKAVWIVYEDRFTTEDDVLVATTRATALLHRSPEEVAADA